MQFEYLRKYRSLIDQYLIWQLDTAQFAAEYLSLFSAEKHPLSVKSYEVLNDVFGVTERYCPDPSLRDQDDATEAEVQTVAGDAIARLDQLLNDVE
jgi:hypothetical protein